MGVRLRVRSSGESSGAEAVYEFDQDRIVIGRGAGADVQLPHRSVSATHATIRTHELGYAVVDEGSTNGTHVGDTRAVPGRPKPLRTGDVLRIGSFALRFETGIPVAMPTSAERTGALARQLVREVLDEAGGVSPPRLVVLNGPDEGRSLELPPPPAHLRIGRGEGCDLVLSDADASREHVELERDLDGVVARDLGSKNGMEVNGRRLEQRRLRDRDELLVGATVLSFEEPAEQELRALDAAEDEKMDEPPEAPRFEGDDAEASGAAQEAEDGEKGSGEAPGGEKGEGGPASIEVTDDRTTERDGGTPPAARAHRQRRGGPSADLLIYVLAGIVLAISLAGLFMLLRAG